MPDDITTVIARLRSSASAAERATAAQRLAILGDVPEAALAAIPLIEACADADDQVRQWAEGALENLGPPRVEDLAALVSILESDRPSQAYWAATLLGRLGPRAASARHALSQIATHHADADVAKRAASALKKIAATSP